MDCPAREYCFGFYLYSLELLDDIYLTLESFTHFRILLLHSSRILAQSKPFLCLPNEHCEVVVNELLSFRAGEETEGCELRLLVVSEEGEERVTGRYEFPLSNYKRAYQELRRNCIELSVQIAPHYALVYDVFLQGSEAALQRIIREHQAAMRSRMHADAISEADSFLPHEISNRDEACRDIRIDEASPLLFHQRFWSPKRGRFGGTRRLSIMSPTSVEGNGESSSLLTDSNRISMLKLSKTASTFSDLEANKARNVTCAASNIQQLDIQSQPQTENHQEQLIQLYEVIKSDSKIVLPDQLEKQRPQRDEHKPADDPKQRKMKHSFRKDNSPVKYIILAVIVLTITGFFLYLFDTPTLHLPKNKRSKKPKRRS